MNDKNKELLEELITDQITYIGKFNPDDKDTDYGAMISSLRTTCSISLDEEKFALGKVELDTEANSELDKRALDLLQVEEKSKDRIVKIVLESAGIVLPIIFYGIWMKRGFKFEETGTFTSQTFRGLFNRFRPTK